MSATGGASGQPVVFTSSTAAVCTTGGTNGATVTSVSAGTCTILANEAGSANYSAAPQVSTNVTINAPATGTTVSCAPGSVTAGNLTTCTVTVADVSGLVLVPAGTVALTSSSAFVWIFASPCSLAGASSTTSTCSVDVLTQQQESITFTATYTPTDNHLASSGTTIVSVTTPTGPTVYVRQGTTGTIGDNVDVYATNCPTTGSAPRLEATYGPHQTNSPPDSWGTFKSLSPFTLTANGSWETHFSLGNPADVGQLDSYGFCTDSVLTGFPPDPAVNYSFPRIVYTVNALGPLLEKGAAAAPANSVQVSVDPNSVPFDDTVGIRLADMLTLKARVDAIAAPTATVSRMYTAFFGRPGDHAGIAYWMGKLRHGTTIGRIAEQFAGSSEFRRTYAGFSKADFVDAVYSNVLHRSPDSGGRAYWLNRLQAGTAVPQMVAAFANSPENIASTASISYVTAAFQALSTRTPTAAQVNRLASELDFGTIRYAVVEDTALSLKAASFWNDQIDAGHTPIAH